MIWLARELDKADQGGERGVLHELHEEAHGRRDRDAHRLGKHHVRQLLVERQPERCRRFPLALRDRLQAAAPDLAKEGRRIEGQGQRRGNPGVDLDVEQRQAEEQDEQLPQQRRALDEVDVARREPVERPEPDDAEDGDDEAEQAAAGRRHESQQDRPAGGRDQVDHIGAAELADHAGHRRTNTSQ